jgi:hypothetical protein
MFRARSAIAAMLALTLVVGASGSGIPVAGAADAVLDANTLPLTTATSGVGMSAGFPLAQTFRAQHDGVLARIDLGVHRYGTQDPQALRVQLTTVRDGTPDVVVAVTSIPASVLPTRATGLTAATFDPAPRLVAGTQYAIVLEPVTACCIFLRYGQPIGAYPDGMLLWVSGGVWSPWIQPSPGVADGLFAVRLLTVDDVPPVVTAPAYLDDEVIDPAGVAISWNATAVDDVDGPIPVTCTPPSGSRFPYGDTTVTCTATDTAGNVGSATILVRGFDVHPPTITFDARPTYLVDEHVVITCAATDAGSGVASTTCGPPYEADGWVVGPGPHTISASAVDVAGNRADVSTTFTVVVDVESLARLTTRLVTSPGVAKALVGKLRSGAFDAYRNQLRGVAGKAVSDADAALLIQLSLSLAAPAP